jgi:hypothetical protein
MPNTFINRRMREEMNKYGRNGELNLRDANTFIKRFRLKKHDLLPLVSDMGLKTKGKYKALKILLG